MALFRAKFACILAIRNPVFRWESCKGSVWECVKNCSSVCKEAGTHGWISRVARSCKPPNWSTCAKHARSWSIAPTVHYRTKVPGWPGRLLAAWTRDSTQSWGQACHTPDPKGSEAWERHPKVPVDFFFLSFLTIQSTKLYQVLISRIIIIIPLNILSE